MGQGGFGEVWKCEAPGGYLKAIKFIEGDLEALEDPREHAEQELQALRRLKAIRHPFLMSVERVEVVDGAAVVVMELADHSLRDLTEGYQQTGQRGVPRDELLGYLDEVAEVLDVLNLQHQLLHLDVKPDNVFLISGHAKLGDFSLVTELEGSASHDRAVGLSPQYAAPEVFLAQPSAQSDQYSLAI